MKLTLMARDSTIKFLAVKILLALSIFLRKKMRKADIDDEYFPRKQWAKTVSKNRAFSCLENSAVDVGNEETQISSV